MLRRLLFFAAALPLLAQKYDGPRPPKPDIPYLKHASDLIPTEVAEAKEEKRKDDVMYAVNGASSSVKTPLASPILLIKSEKIVPDRLQLYRLDTKNGRREIVFSKKKDSSRPIRLEITRLSSDNIYRIEVDQSLEPGEYSLSPDGSNQVFCFQVY
jgi:hypothetical protein